MPIYEEDEKYKIEINYKEDLNRENSRKFSFSFPKEIPGTCEETKIIPSYDKFVESYLNFMKDFAKFSGRGNKIEGKLELNITDFDVKHSLFTGG